MNRKELINQIFTKKSFLCVGLDPDINKIPKHLLELEDPIFEFLKQIVDTTAPYSVAYKPNIAFFECLGIKGLITFDKIVRYIRTILKYLLSPTQSVEILVIQLRCMLKLSSKSMMSML